MKKRIKICVLIGSCNTRSTTQYLAEEIIKRYQSVTENIIDVNIFSGKDTSISDCTGCTNCFINGGCRLDRQDDMGAVKQALLEADIIILGSPVYFHSVSGVMKRFMDRLSYWTHTMELTGKFGITIATSGGNGLTYVSEYLKKFSDYLGIQHLAAVEAATYNMEYMEYHKVIEKIDGQIQKCVDQIKLYVDKEEYFIPEKRQSQIFLAFQEKNQRLNDYRDHIAEVNRWFEAGFHECKDYQEAISKKKKNLVTE